MLVHVLIVDDEANLRESLAAYLEDEGMRPIAVPCAEEALVLAAESADIHVCIMDIRLPGMGGDDAMRALLRHRSDLRFIVYTGSAEYELPEDLVNAGVSPGAVFRKPLPDMAPLAAAVREAAQKDKQQ
jgi:CheY-like chemotaxis protein